MLRTIEYFLECNFFAFYLLIYPTLVSYNANLLIYFYMHKLDFFFNEFCFVYFTGMKYQKWYSKNTIYYQLKKKITSAVVFKH